MKLISNYINGLFKLGLSGLVSQIIALLTWRYLGQAVPLDNIGEFSLNIFWIEVLCIFSLMGVETFYPKYVYDNKYQRFSFNFSRDIFVLSIVFSILFLFLNHLLEIVSSTGIGLSLLIISSVIAITQFRFKQVVQLVEGNFTTYGIYQVARPILFIVIIVIYINLYGTPNLYLSYASSFAVLIFMNVVFGRSTGTSCDTRFSILWIRDSYYFAAVGIFGVISTYSSRLLTDQIFTLSEVGILALLISYAAPVKSLISIFDKIYYPEAIKRLNHSGKLGIELYTLNIILLTVVGFVTLRLLMPIIGSFLALEKTSDIATFGYLVYSFLPMLVWILFVPVIIHKNPKLYSNSKAVITVLVVIFQAVIFGFVSFDEIGLVLYVSECLYLVPLFLLINPYISPWEKSLFILFSFLCLVPVFFN